MSSLNSREKTELDERYGRLRTVINKKYSIESVILKYDQSVQAHPKSIVSILNINDSNPSMFLNYQRNVWHCFSTGKGGGYLELVYWLKVLREQEQHVDIRKLANNILMNDKELQKDFGATSLFKQTLPKVIEPVLRSSQVSKDGIKSLAEIIKKLADREDKSLFFKFIADFELGAPLSELVEKYGMYNSGGKATSASKQFEDLITQLFGGDGK